MNIDRQDIVDERAGITSTLERVGPDAPTLAGNWSTTQLARHLAVQDRLGGIPAFLARRFVLATNVRGTAAYLDRPRMAAIVNAGPTGWEAALRRLHRQPSSALMRRSVAPITLWEHFVHHEDVRRPAGLARHATPDLTAVVQWLLRYNRRRLEGEIIHLVTPDGQQWSTGSEPSLTIQGPPGELVLWLSGRGLAADLQFQGKPDLLDGLTQRMSI